MNRERLFSLVGVSLTCIACSLVTGLLLNSYQYHHLISYADIQQLLNDNNQATCKIQCVVVATGEPTLEVRLSDKTVRTLVVGSEQKLALVTSLHDKGIPIDLLGRDETAVAIHRLISRH